MQHYSPSKNTTAMYSKVFIFFVVVAAVNAGYLQPSLRYGIGFAAPAPAISYAAPAIARVEHLAPAVASVHRTALYTAPIARTSLVAPAVHAVAATPLIASAPLPIVRTGYLGHGFGYGVAHAGLGLARAFPIGYAGAYRAGW